MRLKILIKFLLYFLFLEKIKSKFNIKKMPNRRNVTNWIGQGDSTSQGADDDNYEKYISGEEEESSENTTQQPLDSRIIPSKNPSMALILDEN